MSKKLLVGATLALLVLLCIVTLAGVFSYSTAHSYEVTNQYGNPVKIYGYGIYAHDSFFRVPIFIGTDWTMLVLVAPMLLASLLWFLKKPSEKTRMFLASVVSVVLYYSFSISFGITYNNLMLVYIALFGISLFMLIGLIATLDKESLLKRQRWPLPTKGIGVFLVLSGIALFVAWLPDILSALSAKTSLAMIEVYTTEITYVIDMGVISPLMFICLFLLKRRDGLAQVILSILLTLCSVIGVMLPVQTLFQTMAGIEIPLPALLSKAGSFVVLAVFAVYFLRKLYSRLEIAG